MRGGFGLGLSLGVVSATVIVATAWMLRDRIDVVTHHVYPSEGFASEVTYDLETGGPLPISPPSGMESPAFMHKFMNT